MNKLKNLKFYFVVLFLSFFLWFVFSSHIYAATPKIVNKLTDAFNSIEGWFIKLGTPAAAVAVAVGLFMKKFSFGDEERMRSAKKIIRGSLVAYGVLLALDLILAAIKALVG